jgi:hypothetical protein
VVLVYGETFIDTVMGVTQRHTAQNRPLRRIVSCGFNYWREVLS